MTTPDADSTGSQFAVPINGSTPGARMVNAVLLGIYTFSCHSCRHVIGGKLRNFGPHPIRYRLWNGVSQLNGNHGFWAQVSLFSVAFADFYVYLLAKGVIADITFF